MQNSRDGGKLDRRKKGNDLGLRLQCQQSHLAHAPVIHLLKNEMMLGIWCDWSVMVPRSNAHSATRPKSGS